MIEVSTIEIWCSNFVQSVRASAAADSGETYFIKSGYRSRERAEYFVDDLDTAVYQPDVYQVAVRIALALGVSRLIDVGCGRAQKLVEAAGALETVGIDYGENLAWCRQHFPGRRWLDCDLDRPHQLPVAPPDLARSVLVCSDVVEHLVHPRHLLVSLRGALEHAPMLVLSTPERDLLRGIGHTGPPDNACHVREWNLSEFARLLEHYDLPPRRIGLTRTDDQSSAMCTILAVVNGRRELARRRPTSGRVARQKRQVGV